MLRVSKCRPWRAIGLSNHEVLLKRFLLHVSLIKGSFSESGLPIEGFSSSNQLYQLSSQIPRVFPQKMVLVHIVYYLSNYSCLCQSDLLRFLTRQCSLILVDLVIHLTWSLAILVGTISADHSLTSTIL